MTSTEPAITHEEAGNRGAFYYFDPEGRRLAEMTYSRTTASLVIIDHTHVDPALRGQGVGRKLFDAAVQWARQTHTRIIATCPFATALFVRIPSARDVLG